MYLRMTYVLAKNSPSAWIDFVEAFKIYVASELERSMTAPSAEAQVALGMNRRLLEMRDDFVNIEEKAGRDGRGA
jgi:hypothetical protein